MHRPTSVSSRRTFLRGTSLGAVTTAARSASRVAGANDRINVGIIGVGIMGFGHLRSLVQQSEEKGDIRIAAVSDLYTRRKQRAQDTAKLTAKDVHHDYRDLLARKDLDAVFIAVPEHSHARVALDGLAAGKDLYLQKPMTYTIAEAKEVAEAVKKSGRVLQVGSQHLSHPRHKKAKELIEQGAIGPVMWVQASSSRNSMVGEWNYQVEAEASAQTIDWERWLGSAPKRPFSAERYFRWRKYWDYSGGNATDVLYHTLNPLVYLLNAQFPTRVTGSGGIYAFREREVPDTYFTTIEYPKFHISLASAMSTAAPREYFPTVIYGHNATMVCEGDRVTVVPEPAFLPKNAADAAKSGKVYEVPPLSADMNRLHTDDFFSSVRSRKQPIFNADLGYQVMVAIRLGNDSYREGKVKFFDPASRTEIDQAPPRPAYEGDGTNPRTRRPA